MMPPSRKDEIENTVEKAIDSADVNRQSDIGNSINVLTIPLANLANELREYRDQQEANDKKRGLTERLSVAAIIATVVLTGLTLVVFKLQLGEMEKAYGPIKESAEIADDTAKRQLRAYLLFHSGVITRDEAQESKYIATVSVKNSGQTPAYFVRYRWTVRIAEYPIQKVNDSDFDLTALPDENADIGSAIEFSLGDAQTISISNDDLVAIRNRKKAIYTWGAVEYNDVFQTAQDIRFVAVNLSTETKNGWIMRSYFHSVPDYRQRRRGKDG